MSADAAAELLREVINDGDSPSLWGRPDREVRDALRLAASRLRGPGPEPMTDDQALQWAADTFWPLRDQQAGLQRCTCEVVTRTGPDPVDEAERDPLCPRHPEGPIARGLVINLAREVQRLIEHIATRPALQPTGTVPTGPYAQLLLRPDELALLLHGLRRIAPDALAGYRLDSVAPSDVGPMARSLATALCEAVDRA